MSRPDRDTSHLLPAEEPRYQHYAWVQGRFLPVRTAATLDLTRTSASEDTLDTQSPARTSHPLEDGTYDTSGESRVTPQGHAKTSSTHSAASSGRDSSKVTKALQDKYDQPRGFGIGGAGNIRRPTQVIHGPSRMEAFARGDTRALWRRNTAKETASDKSESDTWWHWKKKKEATPKGKERAT